MSHVNMFAIRVPTPQEVEEHNRRMREALRDAFTWGYPYPTDKRDEQFKTDFNAKQKAYEQAQALAQAVAQQQAQLDLFDPSTPAPTLTMEQLEQSAGQTISQLQEQSYKIALEKGWWHNPSTGKYQLRPLPELLMLVVTEVAEAMEAYRDNISLYQFDENGKPIGLAHELADIVIRVADMAEAYGINLDHAIQQKTAYNKTRPVRHGGKRA